MQKTFSKSIAATPCTELQYEANILKPQQRDHNISMQHITILFCMHLVTLLLHVEHVGCSWLKFENGQIFFLQHLLLLHDVVIVWPGLCNTVAWRHAKFATHCNKVVAKCMQHVAPNNVAICCVKMLWSFGQGLRMLCNILCENVSVCSAGALG